MHIICFPPLKDITFCDRRPYTRCGWTPAGPLNFCWTKWNCEGSGMYVYETEILVKIDLNELLMSLDRPVILTENPTKTI